MHYKKVVLETLNEARLAVVQFLNTDIVNVNLLYFDYYGFIHIITGFIIMWLLVKYKVFGSNRPKQYLVIATIEILWESLEWFFYSKGMLFAIDTPANVAWDFIMNMFGAWLYLKVVGKKTL